MVTECDSSVLNDVLAGSPHLATTSFRALTKAADEGPVIISTIVYAELAGSFGSSAEIQEFIRQLGIILIDVNEATEDLQPLTPP